MLELLRTGFRVLPSNKEEPLARALAELGESALDENDQLKCSNVLHLKMDGWKTILSFWVSAYFQVQAVSFREGSWYISTMSHLGWRWNTWEPLTIFCISMQGKCGGLITPMVFSWSCVFEPMISANVGFSFLSRICSGNPFQIGCLFMWGGLCSLRNT